MGRGARRATLAAALIALLGSVASCRRGPELAPITVLQVRAGDLSSALVEAGLDGATTAEVARSALRSAGLQIDEGARRGYVARLEVVALSAGAARRGLPASAEIVVDLRLQQTWAQGPSPRRSGKGRAALAGAARAEAWREALRLATVEAAAALAMDLRALREPTDRLVGELSAGDPRVRERAARSLASKGARSAVRAIAALVRDRDPGVARAAVDALASFRDPDSALALIDAAQSGDASMILRLIPILAEIGGPDVEGYLLTLRSGHGDRAVRRAAEEALLKTRGSRPERGDRR